MKEIRFYKVRDDYGYFSNFAPFPIFLSGEVWPTVEHYFQASKFENKLLRNKIKSLDSAINAAKEGRNPNNTLRPDWEKIKDDVMRKGLNAKFLQHHYLKKGLLETGNVKLIEHTSNDNYWGDGGDGTGKNKLGILLMEIRNEINMINSDPNVIFPPWIAFPEISQYDMFWRMGLGEDYLYKWSRYYLNLTDKEKYKSIFPEPTEWEGFFD